MARLEDVTAGASVVGIAGGGQPVQVVAAKWHGTNAMAVTYRLANGAVAEKLLFRDNENELQVASGSLPWSFDADADLLRLASEA